MKKSHLVLALLVLFAGCTSSDSKTNTEEEQDTTTPKIYGNELSISFEDFPQTISSEALEYFKIKFDANENIEGVKILVYNLGSFISSSCEGKTAVRDISEGTSKQISCTLKVEDAPYDEVNQNLKFETIYKISQDKGQIEFTVYDSSDFETSHPSLSETETELSIGSLKLDSGNIKEGEPLNVEFDITKSLGKGDICNCNIEEIIFKIPIGFSITGLSGWNRYSCGSFSCFKKENVDSSDISFTLSIAGVTNTETFHLGLELYGIWKQIESSKSITILPMNE